MALKSLVLRSNQYIENYIQENLTSDIYLSSLNNELDSLRLVINGLESQGMHELINGLVRKAGNIEKEILDYIDFKDIDVSDQSNWENIRKVLSEKEAAVEIIRAEKVNSSPNDIIYIFILITKDAEPEILFFSNGDELENQCYDKYQRDLYKEISNDTSSFSAYWSQIDQMLSDKETIYVSPDGVYNKLNLGTLEIPEKRYYIQNKNIVYLNSLLEIVDKGDSISSTFNTACLFGNPDFSASDSEIETTNAGLLSTPSLQRSIYRNFDKILLSELPYTHIEVESIDSMLSSSKWNTSVFLGKDASEANFKRLANPKLLHIATHGFFIEDITLDEVNSNHYYGMNRNNLLQKPMLRSGLLLSGCELTINNNLNNGTEDGVLTANEIMNMNFSNTELVVLSSCSSGRGKIKPGEGVFGLQRAFYLAGTKSALLSLWPVEDRSTKLLMESFYLHWLTGLQCSDALRTAQLELLENPQYNRPIYWGAFVLVGK